MREVGYVEGKHYVLEMRNAAGKPDELASIARSLVARQVDVILVGAGITLTAATAATQTIPIVVAGPEPVQRGVAKSLARPGGNVTGLIGGQMEGMSGKRLELLREIVPNLSRIVMVMNPESQLALAQEMEIVARTLGIAFLSISVTKSEDIDVGIANLPVRPGDGLIVLSESPLWARRARIAELVARKKLPAIYTRRARQRRRLACRGPGDRLRSPKGRRARRA
jgi:putative ABC transport system substrate-binding protein